MGLVTSIQLKAIAILQEAIELLAACLFSWWLMADADLF
jgi:hypothetical protein